MVEISFLHFSQPDITRIHFLSSDLRPFTRISRLLGACNDTVLRSSEVSRHGMSANVAMRKMHQAVMVLK